MLVQPIYSNLEKIISDSRINRKRLIDSSTFPNVSWKEELERFPRPISLGDELGPRFESDKTIQELCDNFDYYKANYVDLVVVRIIMNFDYSFTRNSILSNNNILRRIILLNKVVFYDFNKRNDSKRKYESGTPKFVHPLQVAYTLPKYSPDYLIFAALLHDTVEDSHRYKLLEKWCEGKRLKEEEYLILGINSEQRKITKRKERENVANGVIQTLITQAISIANIENQKTKEKVAILLDALTPRIGEHYQDYVFRIERIDNLELRQGALLVKMGDRLLNSYYPAEKDSGNNHVGRGIKFLKDSVKNFYVLQAAKKHILEQGMLSYPEKNLEFLTRYYALADITNRNMDELMTLVCRKFFLSSPNFRNKGLFYWINKIDAELSKYDGFDLMTKSSHKWSLFDFDESIETLTRFIDIETYHGKNRLKLLRQGKINKESGVGTYLRLYKYAAIIKALSSKFLSHDPFLGDFLAHNSYGRYDPNLNEFYVTTSSLPKV